MKLMNTRELFCSPMSRVDQAQRLYIMTDVQQNHLADGVSDTRRLFSARDVAIIPPHSDYKQQKRALNQSRSLLRQMSGCVHSVETAEGEKFTHDKSPIRDGLPVCHGCVFHSGSRKGMIPFPCPDNIAAREDAMAKGDSLSRFSDNDLRQLTLV